MSTHPHTPAKAPAFENNPFFVAVNGLELLFKKAQTIGIILAVLTALSALGSLPSAFIPPTDDSATMSEEQIAKEDKEFEDGIASVPAAIWLLLGAVVVTIVLICIFIGIVFSGITDYTAAQLSHGREAGFSDALRAVFSNFWSYTWVLIVAGFKTFLWTLLFIIPGIIMTVRYSLSGVIFFDKKLKGNASVKESARLTKGGWLTTFASQSLFNLLTFGIIEMLLVPGTQGVLYQQYRDYDHAKLAKPQAHILSWLTLLIPILLLGTAIVLFVALFAIFSNV